MSEIVQPGAPLTDSVVDQRPIGWLAVVPMMVAVLIAPRWSGPRLAVSSWSKAVAVYLAGTFVSAGLLLGILAASQGNPSAAYHLSAGLATPPAYQLFSGTTWNEKLRRPFARMINAEYKEMLGRWGVSHAITIAIIIPAMFWPAAFLFMPLLAARITAARRYLLSLKLLFWSSPTLLAASVVAICVVGLGECYDIGLVGVGLEACLLVISLAWFGAWVAYAAKLGSRVCLPYATESHSAVQVRCIECGHPLTGSSKNATCPECGLHAASSPPDPRPFPRFAAATSRLRRCTAYWPTLWSALRNQEFYLQLALDRGRAAALRFAMWTAVVAGMSLGIALATFVFEGLDFETAPLRLVNERVFLCVAVGVLGGLIHFAVVLMSAMLASRFGIRDQRPDLIVACYASVAILPAYWSLLLVLGTRRLLMFAGLDLERTRFFGGTSFEPTFVVTTIAVLLAIGMLALGFRHIYRAYHEARSSRG